MMMIMMMMARLPSKHLAVLDEGERREHPDLELLRDERRLLRVQLSGAGRRARRRVRMPAVRLRARRRAAPHPAPRPAWRSPRARPSLRAAEGGAAAPWARGASAAEDGGTLKLTEARGRGRPRSGAARRT